MRNKTKDTFNRLTLNRPPINAEVSEEYIASVSIAQLENKVDHIAYLSITQDKVEQN